MKKSRIIWIYPLMLIGLILMFATGCDKEENSSDDATDYASIIEGTYSGTIIVVGQGSAPASSTLTRRKDDVVDLEIEINSNSIPLRGIDVSSSEDDVYDLEYSDPSGTFIGKVDGNKLTYTISTDDITETFSGTK